MAMPPQLNHFLARLVRHEDLNREEAFELLEALLDAEATDAQISGASWRWRRRARRLQS